MAEDPTSGGPGILGQVAVGELHHIEIWVADLDATKDSWGWLLSELGYEVYQDWIDGRSYRLGATYIVLEQSPDLTDDRHDRRSPGLNHLAFHAGSVADVDRLVSESSVHGWSLLFADRHPFAGGGGHYAAYLENGEGFEVELCAEQSE